MHTHKPFRANKKKLPLRGPTSKKQDAPITTTTYKLQKLLAQKGLGSRREMEELIASGRVSINGRKAVVGDRAGEKDRIQVDKRLIHFDFSECLPRLLLYHKPEGEIVSRHDPEGRPTVFEKLPHLKSAKWIAIGRLDFNTCGLLIFTTDGTLANRLMHPRFEMEREYAVRIIGELTAEHISQLTSGIQLDDGIATFTQLIEQGGEGVNRWYRVTLKEGKNREIRRMFEVLGITVSRLMRIRFGPINLPARIKRGKWLELDEKETKRLLALLT